jgi:hypothetical protein
LRYCIRRPSNCGLLGRNESTPAELAGILEKMKLDLDEPIPAEAATSSVASTSTSSTRKKQPSGIIRNQAESKQTGSALGKIVLDKTHHPVRLPHGECQMVWDESTGRFGEFGSNLMKLSTSLRCFYHLWRSYGRPRHPRRKEAHIHIHTMSSRSRGRLRTSSTSIHLRQL